MSDGNNSGRSNGKDLRSMPENIPSDGTIQVSNDVCELCGKAIKTQAFRGTGACGDNHFKSIHGHARISEVLQERGTTPVQSASTDGVSISGTNST